MLVGGNGGRRFYYSFAVDLDRRRVVLLNALAAIDVEADAGDERGIV